jgi:hypothetical protein
MFSKGADPEAATLGSETGVAVAAAGTAAAVEEIGRLSVTPDSRRITGSLTSASLALSFARGLVCLGVPYCSGTEPVSLSVLCCSP